MREWVYAASYVPCLESEVFSLTSDKTTFRMKVSADEVLLRFLGGME